MISIFLLYLIHPNGIINRYALQEFGEFSWRVSHYVELVWSTIRDDETKISMRIRVREWVIV